LQLRKFGQSGATGGARRDGLAARRLYGIVSIQSGRAGGDPSVPPRLGLLELMLEEANSARIALALQDGSLDAAFLRPGVAGSESFECRFLAMIVAIAAGHPVAVAADLARLNEGPFVLFPRQIGPTLYLIPHHQVVADGASRPGLSSDRGITRGP
jgi:hypothetical protein